MCRREGYSPDRADLWRRGAIYVDKILRGIDPADLPVQQPTQIRACYQSQNSEIDWPHGPPDAARSRRRRD
jgi:hypothetical protein